MARKYLPESTIKEMIEPYTKTIMVRTYQNGNSTDTRRKPTARESKIIGQILYSAMLGLNYGETNRRERIAEDAIINAAEFSGIIMLPEGTNNYDTIYRPLRKLCEVWPKE